jgi:hypothetical protein
MNAYDPRDMAKRALSTAKSITQKASEETKATTAGGAVAAAAGTRIGIKRSKPPTEARLEIQIDLTRRPTISALGLLCLVAALLSLISWPRLAHAQPQMTFHAEPPQQPEFIFGNAWNIFLDGQIDLGAPTRFKALVAQKKIPANSMVYLNSPGGSLLAGLELGRLIRKAGFFTAVRARGTLNLKLGNDRHNADPGVCLSACTLAYLGGTFRWLDPKSVYGVHRISGNGDFGPDAAQVASSMVVQYIREMGGDTDLFDEMTRAGREEINVLSKRHLEALGVVNNGVERARWSIESGGEFVYLKGERNSIDGINKFMLICGKRQLALYFVFDPVGRGDEVLRMGSQSLMVDDQSIPISNLKSAPVQLHNGWVNASFRITPDLLQRIRSAKTVGIAFQYFDGHPLFLGFQGMEITSDGRKKLEGLVATCR